MILAIPTHLQLVFRCVCLSKCGFSCLPRMPPFSFLKSQSSPWKSLEILALSQMFFLCVQLVVYTELQLLVYLSVPRARFSLHMHLLGAPHTSLHLFISLSLLGACEHLTGEGRKDFLFCFVSHALNTMPGT